MLVDLISHHRLIFRLAWTDFRGQYSGSVLGIIWAFVNPLILIVMYTVIFAVVLQIKVGAKGDVTDFGLFLICGMIPFSVVADAIRRAATVYWDQAHLLHRIVMPPLVLPASRVLLTFFEQMIALLLFLILLLVIWRPPGFMALGLLLLIPLQLAIAFGLALTVACLSAILRDFGALVGPILTIWFLGTPVIYPQQLVPPTLNEIIQANPMTPLVEGYRSLILYHRLPPASDWLYIAAIAFFALLAGHWSYRQTRAVIIDRV